MNRPPVNDQQGETQGRYGQSLGSRWRVRERAWPTDGGQVCAVFEFYDAAAGWKGVFALRPDGKIARADGQVATFAPEV